MLADEADGVAVIDHDHGAVFFGEIADALKIGDDAVHREDAVGGDQLEAAALGLLQLLFERRHVVVGVAEALGLGEAHAVDDRGVVQRVGDDRVLLRQQRFEQAAIGIEAGGIEDRVLHAEKRRDPRLELLVLFLRAADEAHRGHAVAIAVERLSCRPRPVPHCRRDRDSCWRRNSAPSAPRGDLDLARLLGGDDTLGLVETGGFQTVKFGRQMSDEG